MWVLKARGESYYVDHVDCNVPWSTKETPDNPSTKGSIKVKNCLLTIDDDNHATLSPLTPEDRDRLNAKKEPILLITSKGKQLREALKNHNIKHGMITVFGGGCSTNWYVVSVFDDRDVTLLGLRISDIRKLMPNEDYHKRYSDKNGGYEIESDEYEEELFDN